MVSAKLTLDKRRKKKDGTYPVKITISNGKTSSHISLGVSLHPSAWDNVRCRTIGTGKHLQPFLVQRLNEVQDILLRLHPSSTTGATEIKNRVLAMMHPKTQTFGECFMSFVERHENLRTREIYLATLSHIRRYDNMALQSKMDAINRAWLDGFFAYLANFSPSINARNIHLRNIRAVFNDAIDNEVTTFYPFRRYKIHPVATAKRSLTISEMSRLLTCHDDTRYLAAFRLSFLLIGMNLADLLTLTTENVNGNRIVYHRKKTHKLYSIKIEPEAQALLDKWRGERYLFRFLDDVSYRYFINRTNSYLHTLHPGLSMYYARHTWATIAAELDIPDDTISMALGHSARNTTTDIYIRRNREKVDRANRKVIDVVLDSI